MTNKELLNQAQEIVEAANSKGEAIEALIKSGFNYKDSEQAWKEFGSRKVTQGFKAKFFARLKEGKLEGEELDAYIKEHGSRNDYAQKSINIAIAKLTNSIHDDIANASDKSRYSDIEDYEDTE